MHETDESGKGIRFRTSARRTLRGQSGVRKIHLPSGKRESRTLGELSIFTHPSIPEVPQPMFNFSSAALAICEFNRNFLCEVENAPLYVSLGARVREG